MSRSRDAALLAQMSARLDAMHWERNAARNGAVLAWALFLLLASVLSVVLWTHAQQKPPATVYLQWTCDSMGCEWVRSTNELHPRTGH